MRLRNLPFVALLLALPVAALAGENVTFDSLPPPVKATVQREVKDAHILDIERDTKHGKVVFEVEFVESGKHWELHVAEDGKLLSRHPD